MALGFLGSFGHCVGMCGPLAVALSLSEAQSEASNEASTMGRSLLFHGLLNLGRILSYTLVGAGIGAIGSVLVSGGGSLSVLRPDAAYPGDLANDSQWVRAEQSVLLMAGTLILVFLRAGYFN